MLRDVLTWPVGLMMLGAIVVVLLMWGASFYYNRNAESRKIKADFLRAPINGAFVLTGLLMPALSAAAGYMYKKNPSGNYSWLLASLAVFFAVLVLCLWQTASLLKKAGEGDAVEIKFPDDRKFITVVGLVYALLFVGLFYVAAFFLFDFSPGSASPTKTIGVTHYYLAKPKLRLRATRDEVRDEWGNETAINSTNNSLLYSTGESRIELVFDSKGQLIEIKEKIK